jgi:hypothetical protein
MPKTLSEGIWRLRLTPYAGGRYDLVERGSMAECRERAARRIRWHRNKLEYPVTVLEAGYRWELETGDDAIMIGDGEGIMSITPVLCKCARCKDVVNLANFEGGLCHDCRADIPVYSSDDEEE